MNVSRELRAAADRLRESVVDAAMAQSLGGAGADVAGAFGREAQALLDRLNDWSAKIEQLEEGDRIPAAAAIDAQEEERRRLARDIHDGPAQILANVVFRIDVSQQLLEREPAQAALELEQLKALVRRSLQDVRRIIFDLRPMVLDDLGLVPALRDYVAAFEEQAGIAAAFEVLGEERRLVPTIELAGFRLVQEALANVRNHSGAGSVEVRLTFGPGGLRVEVADDGAGFDPRSTPSRDEDRDRHHFGLRSMRERATLLGGSLEVQSTPGRGTRVVAEFPADGPDRP